MIETLRPSEAPFYNAQDYVPLDDEGITERNRKFLEHFTTREIDTKVQQMQSGSDQISPIQLNERIDEIDCGKRPVYIISDTHLNPDGDWASSKALEKLCSILIRAIRHRGIVIFNGDFFEGWLARDSSQRFFESIKERGENGNPIHQSDGAKNLRNFVKLCRNRYIDAIILEGNHDPLAWYNKAPEGQRIQDVLGCHMRSHIVLNQNGKRIFVTHGNRLFKDADEVNSHSLFAEEVASQGVNQIIQKIQGRVGNILRGATTYLETYTNGINPQINQHVNGIINDCYKKVVGSWVKALAPIFGPINSVELGHSHLPGKYDMNEEGITPFTLGVGGVGKGETGRIEYVIYNNGERLTQTQRGNSQYRSVLQAFRKEIDSKKLTLASTPE